VNLVVSAAGLADIERLHGFLYDKGRAAAARVVLVLDTAMRSLTASPERGRPTGVPGVRELIVPFGQSAYLLRYAYLAEPEELSSFASGMDARTALDLSRCAVGTAISAA
jgi:plasmid stabilization system protein ParE